MFSIIAKNLFGFDLLIIVLAIVNGFYIYPSAKKASEALKEKLQPTVYVPINVLLKSFRSEGHKVYDLHEIKHLKEKEAFYGNILMTVLSVFPLMGILGTIISLLRMVDLASTEVLLNFTTALTSTFWGLVFAIGFRGLTTNLASMIEQNSENFELLIRRIDASGNTISDDDKKTAESQGDVDEAK